jgi:hypothetical protein
MQRRHYFFLQKIHSLEHTSRARICKPFKEPRNRFPIWRAGTITYMTYRPARKHRLAESIPWNRFLGSIIVYKYGFCSAISGSISWSLYPTSTNWFTLLLSTAEACQLRFVYSREPLNICYIQWARMLEAAWSKAAARLASYTVEESDLDSKWSRHKIETFWGAKKVEKYMYAHNGFLYMILTRPKLTDGCFLRRAGGFPEVRSPSCVAWK